MKNLFEPTAFSEKVTGRIKSSYLDPATPAWFLRGNLRKLLQIIHRHRDTHTNKKTIWRNTRVQSGVDLCILKIL
ncbi:hypothetical protein Q5P01_001328 [Channa striata]|uniref:Uncharacterized protein n=1 Tax=Channa striata TaxID=64152 RepID=A0AA88NP60_CHASR|nr:hypothetical protein Q5P01_001328 [Channa striata]